MMSIEELERMIPVIPPIVNITRNPTDHNIAGSRLV